MAATNIETMPPRFNHREAFCLMRYESDDKRIVELLWNSRDGVTPFTITARDGKTLLTHTMRHMEFRPVHTPQIGDRVFVDMTREKAQEYAQLRSIAHAELWEAQYPADGEKVAALQSVAESIYAGGHAPDIVTVTEHGFVSGEEARLKRELEATMARLRLERVKSVLKENLRVSDERLEPTAKLIDDLGAESMDMAEVLMDLELEFEIHIVNDAWREWTTVGDIVAFITAQTGKEG